jgi:hypothetical protein
MKKQLLILGSVFFILFSSCVTANLSTDLVSYYKFDGDADDSVGTNDGTVTGPTNSASYGKINQGYSFDGTDDYIDIKGGFFDSTTLTSGTMNIWFNLNGNTPVTLDSLISAVGGSGRYIYLRFASSTLIGCGLRNGEGSDISEITSNAWSTTGWYMITMTWDSSGTEMFINGVSKGTSNYASGWTSGDSYGAGIGSKWKGTGWFLQGYLDEGSFWSRTLTSTELTELYNSGNGLQYPFTTGWTGNLLGILNPSNIMGVSVKNLANIMGVV